MRYFACLATLLISIPGSAYAIQNGDSIEILSPVFGCPNKNVEATALHDFKAASDADDRAAELETVRAAEETGCRPFDTDNGSYLVVDVDSAQRLIKIDAGYDEDSNKQLYFWVPEAFVRTAQ